MRTIGILGGMAWPSTAELYRLVNELVVQRLGEPHSARCLIASVDFAEVARCQREDRWDDAGALLAGQARALERAGAECLVLATNTMHKVAPAIEGAVAIPFLHVVDAVAARLAALGATRAGLLGTRFTMTEPFYVDLLGARGIDAVVPDAAGQRDVHDVIFSDLVHGRRAGRGAGALRRGDDRPRRARRAGGHPRLHRDRVARLTT